MYQMNRIQKLLESNYGRTYGWFVEFDGQCIGRLIEPVREDMFWDVYKLIPKDSQSEQVLHDPVNWEHCKFKFRNILMDEYAFHPFAGWGPDFVRNGKVCMRALYLLPEGIWEKLLVKFSKIFSLQSYRDRNGHH
jgi:hypothetical protein